MPIPQQRDLALARDQLTAWLESRLPAARRVSLSDISSPATTGFSSETLMFDASWEEDGDLHSEGLVVRVQPTAYAIFLEPNFDAQGRVLRALDNDTDVPVPPMLWMEPDESILGAPFYVMRRIDGRTPADSPPYHVAGWVTEVRPGDRRTLWLSGLDAMTRVHTADWATLGLGFLDQPERGATPLDQQLAYYDAYFRWTARGRPHPLFEAARAWLHEHRPGAGERVRLCWGDSRIGNMIFDERFECRAVLDWEMVTLGNPEQDLAWWLFVDRFHSEGIGVPRLAGFPSRQETVATWERAVGLRAGHLDYYEVFAGMRFAVVMMRIAQLGVEYGLMPPDTPMFTDNGVTRLLARLLGLPAPVPG